jgi:hypothetical protein
MSRSDKPEIDPALRALLLGLLRALGTASDAIRQYLGIEKPDD